MGIERRGGVWEIVPGNASKPWRTIDIRDKGKVAARVGTRDGEGNWEGESSGSQGGDWSIELAGLWGNHKASKFRGPAGRWKCKTQTLGGSQARGLDLSLS